MISVIIPTYNRCSVLVRTLEAYGAQDYGRLIREIIIIDDGSTDGTAEAVRELQKHSKLNIVYMHQDNCGPARARNRGIAAAGSRLVFITGDDIVPDEGLVKEHFETHKRFNFDKKIAVLGKVAWPSEIKVTPFMEYINEFGLQFGYSIIPNADNVPYNFFYTSNISLNRSFLLQDKLFSPKFPHAAWEDCELGYRLSRRGLRIVYNRHAVGYHHHAISFSSFRRRQELSGYSACIFASLHPELENWLGINREPGMHWRERLKSRLRELYCLFADKFLPFSYPRFYDELMDIHYQRGVKRYKSETVQLSERMCLGEQRDGGLGPVSK
jgi:glycosyltransferase involved in cell wall biosynthesis